jgi:CheY-like chemotaxis protein
VLRRIRQESRVPVMMLTVRSSEEDVVSSLDLGADDHLAKPAERGELYPKQQEIKQWGLTARNLSFLVAKEMKRKNLDGVMVTSVRPGGPAGEAKPALGPRDVIVEVNGKPVKSVQDLIEITRELTEGKTERVPVVATFERKAARYLAVVKVGIQELKDPGLCRQGVVAGRDARHQPRDRQELGQRREGFLSRVFTPEQPPTRPTQRALHYTVDGEADRVGAEHTRTSFPR